MLTAEKSKNGISTIEPSTTSPIVINETTNRWLPSSVQLKELFYHTSRGVKQFFDIGSYFYCDYVNFRFQVVIIL